MDEKTMVHEVKLVENVEKAALLTARAERDSVPTSSTNENNNEPGQSDLPETVMSPNDIGASACPEGRDLPDTQESPHKLQITFSKANTQAEILQKIQQTPEFRKSLSAVVKFGRDPTNNDIVFPPDTMSRQYIEIQLRVDKKKLVYIVKNVSKNKRVTVGEEVLLTNEMVQVEGKTTINLSNDLIFVVEAIPGDIGYEAFSVSLKISDELKETKSEPLSKVEMLPESSAKVVSPEGANNGDTNLNQTLPGSQSLNMESLRDSLPMQHFQNPNSFGQPLVPGYNQYTMMRQAQVSQTPWMGHPPPYDAMTGQNSLHHNSAVGQMHHNQMYRQQSTGHNSFVAQPQQQFVHQIPYVGHQNSMGGPHFVHPNQMAAPGGPLYIQQSASFGQPYYQPHPAGHYDRPQTPDSACIMSPDYHSASGANMFPNTLHDNLHPGLQRRSSAPITVRRSQGAPDSIPVLTLSTEIFRQAPSIISSVGSVNRIPTEHAESKCPD